MSKKVFRVGPIILSLVALISMSFIPLALAEDTSPHKWLTANDYFVSSASLPANQVPYSKGTDCELGSITDPLTTKVHAGCAVNTSIGMIIDSIYTDGENGFGRVSQLFLPSVGGDQLMYNGSGVVGYRGGLKKSNLHYGSEIYTYTASVDFGVRHLATDKYQIGMGPDIAFSNNGKWMVAIVSDKTVGGTGIMLFDTESYTGRMIAYNALAPEDTSLGLPNLAVSDDGKYVASGYSYRLNGVSKMRGLRVYDTTTCGDMYGVKLNSDRKDCAYKNLWTGAKSGPGLYSEVAAGAGVLGQMSGSPIRPLNVRFKDDQTITFSAVHDFVDNAHFQASSYTISLTPPVLADETINLMALGDSYISGEGAEHMVGSDDVSHYVPGTNTSNNKCHNSDLSYPYLLGAKYADTFHSVACSGAKTGNIYSTNADFPNQLISPVEQGRYSDNEVNLFVDNKQLGTIEQNIFVEKLNPNVILLSIGGNDLGFSNIVKRCVTTIGSPCYKNQSERRSLLRTIYGTHNALTTTYRKILDSSPGARLYVMGYPQVVNATGSCGANVHLDDDERKLANMLIDRINDTIRNAASAEGVVYVDVNAALNGHRLCDEDASAMNGLTSGDDGAYIGFKWFESEQYLGIGNESYHPTAFGHQLLAASIGRQTEGLSKALPSPTNASALQLDEFDPFISGAVKDNDKTRMIVFEQITKTPVVKSQQTIQLQVNPAKHNIPKGTDYRVVFHSEVVEVATGKTGEGNLNLSVEVPDLSPGVHELHVYAADANGEDLDLTQYIFVTAYELDFDGDGIVNEDDPLPFINEQRNIVAPPVESSDEDVDDAGVTPEVSHSPDSEDDDTVVPTQQYPASTQESASSSSQTPINQSSSGGIVNQPVMSNNDSKSISYAASDNQEVLSATTSTNLNAKPKSTVAKTTVQKGTEGSNFERTSVILSGIAIFLIVVWVIFHKRSQG